MIKIKERTLFLVIIGALFLWISSLYINFNSHQSDATTIPSVQIGFSTDKLVVQKNQPISIDLYMKSTAAISGATISLLYPTDIFEYQPPKDTSFVSRGCATYPMLKNFVAGKNNLAEGYVSITRVSIDKNENLPKGYFCFGTITFIPKANLTWPASGVFRLDSSIGSWQITGPENPSYAVAIMPEKSKLVVSIDGECSLKTHGDVNCDRLVDLADFELWRKAYTHQNQYSEAADFDGDRKNTVKDFEAWRQGFYNAIEPTPSCIPLPPCALPGSNLQCALKIPPTGISYCPYPSTVPTIIIDECSWCGNRCMNGPLPPNTVCPAVAPDPGLRCERGVRGICEPIVISPTPTATVLCRWCGSICTSSANLMACPSMVPPAGMTCTQIQEGCQAVTAY